MTLCVSRGLDVRLDAYARLEKGFLDDDLLPRMAEAGFRTLYWGLESGNDRVLKSMRKGTTTRRAAAILEAAARAGLSNHCFVLVGFPGETLAEAEDTLAFLEEHAEAIDAIGLQAFVLSRDAPVGKDPARWGLVPHADGSYDVASGLSQAEAARLVTLIERRHQLGGARHTRRAGRASCRARPASASAAPSFSVTAFWTPRPPHDSCARSPSDLYPLMGGAGRGPELAPARLHPDPDAAAPAPARRKRAPDGRGAPRGGRRRHARRGAGHARWRAPRRTKGDESALAAFLASCLLDGLALGFREAFPS